MKILAQLSIAIYAVAISLVTIFFIGWDNKGAKDFWDKLPTDWLSIIWLAFSCVVTWLAVWRLWTNTQISSNHLIGLGLILIINASFALYGVKGEALLYLGIPHIFFIAGYIFLYLSMGKMQP